MILYIKHIDIEGPETIAPFFEEAGFKSQVIELYNGHQLPERLKGIEAVVCLGGPMNVYEEDKYPFLKNENVFIQRILDEEIPFLGICLGSQLLSKAAGGKVTRSPHEEIGWRTIELTSSGRADPLFEDLPDELFVYQWHGDMFSIPENGSLLGTGEDCPHQALKVGKNAYGFQFHIEITDKSIREWSDEYFSHNPALLHTKKAQMLAEYEKNRTLFENEGKKVYNNFLKIIRG